MTIGLKQAALLLGTSESMLHRWIQQGVVPVFEENGEYRFESKKLEAWAQNRQLTKKKYIGHNTVSDESPSMASLSEAMRRGGVHFCVKGGTVSEVLEMALDITPIPEEWHRQRLLKRLLEREALASTGLGRGIAVPHPRYPMQDAATTGIVSTCFLENAVDFGAIDGKPVFVLFLMLNPNAKSHLQLLSKLMFCLHNVDFQRRLSTCKDEDTLLRYVKQTMPKN